MEKENARMPMAFGRFIEFSIHAFDLCYITEMLQSQMLSLEQYSSTAPSSLFGAFALAFLKLRRYFCASTDVLPCTVARNWGVDFPAVHLAGFIPHNKATSAIASSTSIPFLHHDLYVLTCTANHITLLLMGLVKDAVRSTEETREP